MRSTKPSSESWNREAVQEGRFEVFFTDPLYLTYKNFLYNYLVRRFVIRRAVRKNNSGRILELGCGISPMLEPGTNVVQTDISWNALKYLTTQSKDKGAYRTLHCDGTRLPFLSQSFDLIVCSEVIEHIEEDQKLLDEIARILKKNGILLLTCPVHPRYYGFDDEFVGHFRRYEIAPLRERLSRLGMKEIQVLPLLGSLEKILMEKVTRLFAALKPGKKKNKQPNATLGRFFAVLALPFYILLNAFLALVIYGQAKISSLKKVVTVCFQCRKA